MVIGAGIGGLCLAQGLRRAGVSVAVYERDRTPDTRVQGYRLNIEPVGSQALHECLPPELWETLVATAGDPGPGMGVFDERLRQLMREHGSAEADPVHGTHAVSRATLRRLLLAGLDEVVHFDKEFVRYELSESGRAIALFSDGSSAVGDVLVAADGARSRVRQQYLPYVGTVDAPGIGIGGKRALDARITDGLPESITSGKNMILPGKDFLFTAVFRRRETVSEVTGRLGERLRATGLDPEPLLREAEDHDYVMWAFVANRASYPADLASLHGPALRDLVEARGAGWHPELRRLVAESDPGTVEQFRFTAATKPKPWPSTNVTLLGDAIHCMPPVGGLGGNTALRDASLLCRALTSVHRGESPVVPAIAGYEAEMIKYGFAAVHESSLYLRLAISRSRLLRATARGFFRLCGAVPPLRRAVFADE